MSQMYVSKYLILNRYQDTIHVCEIPFNGTATVCQDGSWGDDCDHPRECYYEGQAMSYRGGVNVSESGAPCLTWSQVSNRQVGHSPSYQPDGSLDGAECRMPLIGYSKHTRPWCYTQQPESPDDPPVSEACLIYECGSKCGRKTYTAQADVIQSPGYPNPYPAYTKCEYDILVEDGFQVELHFEFFDSTVIRSWSPS